MTAPRDSEATRAQKAHLLNQMDVTMIQKLAFASAHFQLHDGARILDIGCARGNGSYHIAALNPRLQVIGLDYDQSFIDEARATYKLPNLSFVRGDARNLDLGSQLFDAIFNSSVMHEIYSFSNYADEALTQALKSQLAHLRPGGTILLRDFMRAASPEAMVYMDLLSGVSTGSDPASLSYADLLRLYSRIADSLKPEELRGFFMEEIGTLPDGWERFYLPHDRADEFIWRKEYRDRFEIEAREKYAPLTARQYREIPESLGARAVYTAPYHNPWIAKHWYEGKVRLFDEALRPLPLPPSNYIALIRKLEEGESMRVREHRAAARKPGYLKLEHFRNSATGGLYDLVSRPGDVYDVIPYGTDGRGHTVVYAKSGYPRPIPNIHPRQMSPNLDGKSWSGHMVEPLAVANEKGSAGDAVRRLLQERTAFDPGAIGPFSEGLTYYTAPADVNEKVSSVFVPVKDAAYEAGLKGKFSGFGADGSVRAFEIQDLLRGVQVGMLPEARLEMNIYALMRKLGVTPENWIGDSYRITEAQIPAVADLETLLAPGGKAFDAVNTPASWLKVQRSVFVDEAAGKKVLATQELEFAVPANKAGEADISTNSVMAIPLVKDSRTGEILMGVQARDFPSVQAQDGQSRLLTVPGFRLPSSVRTLGGAQGFLAEQFPGAQAAPLGEGYFPSMGILPNRVFPYIVTGAIGQSPHCAFVPLRDLFDAIPRLHDAHLILAVCRSVHALGLWGDYSRDLKPRSEAQLTLGR